MSLPEEGWPGNGTSLALRAVLVLVGLNALCLLGALPASFRSDLRRPESPGAAVRGFFRDLRRIARERTACSTLLTLAGFQGLVAASAGPLVTGALRSDQEGLENMLASVILAGIGVALGSGAAALVAHPRRCLGLVPLGAAGMVASLIWALLVLSPDGVPLMPCLALGYTCGLINAPLRAAYLASVPADARGNGTSVMNTAIYLTSALLAGTVIALTWVGLLTSSLAQLAFLTVLATLGTVLVCVYLFPPLAELICAWVFLPFYSIRGHGPGLDRIPTSGPLLIVANHSAYVDAFFIGKVIPRRFTPMMISVFYDRPVLRWLMRWVVGAIRVQDATFRRVAPELAEAGAHLRAGGCVLLFPEALLRRREDQLLRMFGQGVWHILREAPQTPVLVCWIEGAWGSITSHRGGPPFTNKRMDWRRPIDVAFAEAQVLPAEVLADQRATRLYLMRACLECRRYLGLEVPASQETPERDHETGITSQETDLADPLPGVHPINP
jgi:1-acyl-sn-glycerol-3-phosphate acyltransferase